MPYVMVRPEKNLTGNDRYEGFCIDLLKAIAGKLPYYAILLVADASALALSALISLILSARCLLHATKKSRCDDKLHERNSF